MASSSVNLGYPELIADGDTVIISGGGLNKTLVVKHKTQSKLGRCGNVLVGSIIGQRYGDVFAFDDKKRTLVPTLETPELDRSDIHAAQVAEEGKDNRELFDTHGANQNLTESKINEIREAQGVESVVQTLVENSTTFASKTAFAQEKYVRKKKGKYIVKFKVERVNPDNLCETIVPTLLVEMNEEDDCKKRLPIRVDTMGLILHHANVSGSMRVMIHDRSNGLLPASILYRLGAEGQLLGVYDRTSQPATAFARMMHIPEWKARWKAIPASPQLFSDEAAAAAEAAEAAEPKEVKMNRWGGRKDEQGEEGGDDANPSSPTSSKSPSQWVRAMDARRELATSPADSLVIAGFEDEIIPVVKKLFPFLALSGNLVIYCPFIEPLERVYALIRDEAVCISISDTWYRHQQILPGRTHPQVNMNTAGGFILTAVKVESGSGVTIGAETYAKAADSSAATEVAPADESVVIGEKRARDEADQPSRAEAEASAVAATEQ